MSGSTTPREPPHTCLSRRGRTSRLVGASYLLLAAGTGRLNECGSHERHLRAERQRMDERIQPPLTVDEIAELTGIEHGGVLAEIHSGRLLARKIRGRYLITAQNYTEWLAPGRAALPGARTRPRRPGRGIPQRRSQLGLRQQGPARRRQGWRGGPVRRLRGARVRARAPRRARAAPTCAGAAGAAQRFPQGARIRAAAVPGGRQVRDTLAPMPPRASGEIKTHAWADGRTVSYSLRVRAYGERHQLKLG